jgi:hypothetical protein
MDELGFVEERCDDCGARLYLGTDAPADKKPICLNACKMSVGAFRRMQAGLAEAQQRLKEGADREHKG